MNNKAKDFVKNFSYTLASNLVTMIISVLVTLVIPKMIGLKEYGYWQLYIFYSSYVGFLHFGWNDGIYLRYGGIDYNLLDKGLFFSQFYMLVMSQFIVATLITLSSYILLNDYNKLFILIMVSICLIFTNVRYMLLYILQCTNRIKEYSQIIIIGRIFYCCLIIVLLVFGIRDYKLMIISDLIGRLLSLTFAMYCCRDIVFHKISTFYFSFKETFQNISVGIKLMFANIASMLIIGVVRFGIERVWDVTTFGKVSLTLSISNFLMLFINSVGLIMFPILRRTNENKLMDIYVILRDFLMVFLLGVLISYYPLKIILGIWLPKYTDSLNYMAIVFPMCVYEGKMALLINTYLKTLREERLMLKINFIILILSIITTLFTTLLLRNLNIAILSIVILLAFKAILSEVYLSRLLNIPLYKDIFIEIILSVIFILSGWFVNSWGTMIIYGLAYIIFLLFKKKDIIASISNIIILIKS